MKVTAIIDDEMIKDAMRYSQKTTITDTLKIALKEYIRLHKLKELSKIVQKESLEFDTTAEEIRNLNRQQ